MDLANPGAGVTIMMAVGYLSPGISSESITCPPACASSMWDAPKVSLSRIF